MSKKLHCEHCATPINPDTEVYFESEYGIVFCEECADDFLMFSNDIQAYVHEEEYREVYFDDDLSDIDPFTKHEPESDREFSFVVSVLDEQNNPSDNLDAFVWLEDAIDYAKHNPGTAVFKETYVTEKNICEYELVWHPFADSETD